MKKILLLILPVILLFGCSFEVQRGIPVDLSQKTMTVPATTGSCSFEVTKELRNSGWKLKISDASLEEKDQTPKKRVTEVKFDTAYRLYVQVPKHNRCYITVVENESNEMILEVSTWNKDPESIAERFVEELEKIE